MTRKVIQQLTPLLTWGITVIFYYGDYDHDIVGEPLNKWSILRLAGFATTTVGVYFVVTCNQALWCDVTREYRRMTKQFTATPLPLVLSESF